MCHQGSNCELQEINGEGIFYIFLFNVYKLFIYIHTHTHIYTHTQTHTYNHYNFRGNKDVRFNFSIQSTLSNKMVLAFYES